MEAAVRWSRTSTGDSQRFMIADVAKNRLRYCEVKSVKEQKVSYREISLREKIPNFTAFDWSLNDESLVAIGTAWGESRVIKLYHQTGASPPSTTNPSDIAHSFPVRLQRKCNSITFNRTHLLATGLDRIRNDSSLNIYDIRASSSTAPSDPYRRFANSEVVTSVKFFRDEPEVLLAGIFKQSIRLYDLREANPVGIASFQTRYCHSLAIDPLDEHYFASSGTSGENVVNVWDRRFFARPATTPTMGSSYGAVLEISPAIRNETQANIWSLRFNPYKRGCFAILSSVGQVRYIEIASFEPERDNSFANLDGARRPSHGSQILYTRRNHDLQYPWYDRYFGQDENARAIAFDFINPGSLAQDQTLLTICQDKSLEIINIPDQPSLVNINAANEISVYRGDEHVNFRPGKNGTIAEDLIAIQERVWQARRDKETESGTMHIRNGMLDLRSRIISLEQAKFSSYERHMQLSGFYFPPTRLSAADILTIESTQRRRCEEGYLFSCELNKEIVKNDAWLVDLWEVVKRLDDMAHNNGMAHEALDLSYLGVYNIWRGDAGPNSNRISRRVSDIVPDFNTAIKAILSRQRYDPFQGVATKFPARRQLGLAVCGWRFNEKKLREKCDEIVERREYYKAIAVAVSHGRKDVAMSILKSASRAGHHEVSGLAAVIAVTSVSKDQREMCQWMLEEAVDPYLKALLMSFVCGSWNPVVDIVELPLVYRVAVALKYLDDDNLGSFLENATRAATQNGDIEGIVLTGLAERSMDLFQNFITNTNDLQTAVLASAFTNPRYVDDMRWSMWKETYFNNMQTWRTFIERTRFTVQHNRQAMNRDGQRLVQVPPRQVSLRCHHCQGSVARHEDSDPLMHDNVSSTSSRHSRTKTPGSAAGTVCPRCGRHMPRCAICMLWLGTPDPAKPTGAAALANEEPLAKFVNFCLSCNHGFHAHHAHEWFAKHQMCPVPDCHCLCALRR